MKKIQQATLVVMFANTLINLVILGIVIFK